MSAVLTRAKGLTFRARLSILTAAAVGLTVALAALASYLTVRHVLLNQIDSSLRSEVSAPPIASGDSLDSEQIQALMLANGSVLQLITSQGQVVGATGSSSLPVQPGQSAVASTLHGDDIRTVTYEGAPYRVITVGGYQLAGIPVAVQVGRPLGDTLHTLAALRLILWLVTLAGIAAAVGIGFVIGRTMLRPIARLTDAAEHVASTQDLDSTIDIEGHDELASLATSFNAMLTALAASRQQQAQLISDAGHELRTPLTSLRTNIEVLMKVPDLPEADRTELISDIQAQLEELTTLIGDVVDLAREEEMQADPVEVRLDTIVLRAVERAKRRAPGLTFDCEVTPGSVRAQPTLLERAILNVLDNAAKWSPAGGRITVRLRRSSTWTLDVEDQGPGISSSDLPYVFDRFYRAASARSMPGSGLGLAIVRQVISNHGGTVGATCPPSGGTVVHIELPTVTEAEPELVDTQVPSPIEAWAPPGDPAPADRPPQDGPQSDRPRGPDNRDAVSSGLSGWDRH